MSLNIRIFGILDRIATDHDVKMKDWAAASNIEATRISELRKLYRTFEEGKEINLGRAFSLAKCILLSEGLMRLLGEKVVKGDLLKLSASLKRRKNCLLWS